MAPIKIKQSPNPTAQTLTSTTSSQEARLLVLETLRISANLASAPAPPAMSQPSSISSYSPVPSTAQSVSLIDNSRRLGLVEDEFIDSSLRLICCEEVDGRRWKYLAENDGGGRFKKNSIRAVSLQTPQAPVEEVMSFIRSYVVPEGFPDSVIPSYVPYMTWRALKHFFGGAMGVFTTKALLSSVGVSKSKAIPGAVAINWILKDGAGRVGKMLFARQGKKFDYDLKQNVAAVTSTSTRTPIYKAFAKGENIGDVTAKGECVGNLADLLGTGLSIMIAKRNPSLFTTFAFLSCGYVLSSYQEVKSVVLHTLNRARFSVAVDSFLKTGRVPSLQEGNMKEDIFSFPWLKDRPIVLGPRFKEAFQDPSAYLAIQPLFEKERYIVTYNPSRDTIYALLKDQAKADDILKAAFHAHVLLHFIQSSNNGHSSSRKQRESGRSNYILSANDLEVHIAESCKMVSTLYDPFKSKAAEQGWRMSDSLLNPGRARLIATC
ncbi:protein root UVB sensitive 6 isoform X2 [Jatropha curcas]|uniref:protein root UVB sensitive 6 isoform X2 n=1 Tax=Jatropha curcas TaxID=180498 RepID=UPI0005FA9FBB|nr:protein root UVB sensitive 6 isoform X2 [Jatropha curcas]